MATYDLNVSFTSDVVSRIASSRFKGACVNFPVSFAESIHLVAFASEACINVLVQREDTVKERIRLAISKMRDVPCSRLTIAVSKRITFEKIEKETSLAKVDVLAIHPMTEEAFVYACESAPIDIVDMNFLDAGRVPCRVPFTVRRAPVLAAIARGVVFDFSVSFLTDGAELDTHAANARVLLRVSGGRGVVLTSGTPVLMTAGRILERAALFGKSMKPSHRRAAVTSRPACCLGHARRRQEALVGPVFVLARSVEALEEEKRWMLGGIAHGEAERCSQELSGIEAERR